MKTYPLLFAGALLVSGCTTTQPTTIDASNAGKIRVINLNEKQYFVNLSSLDPDDCRTKDFMVWVNGGRETDTQRVGMLDSEPPREGVVERLLPAENSIVLAGLSSPRLDAFTILTGLVLSREKVRSLQSGACYAPEFTPRKDEEYELSFNPQPGSCEVTLKTMSRENSGVITRKAVPQANLKQVCPKK